MKKSYLFIFNSSLGTKEKVHEFVEQCESIDTWRKELNDTYFVVSELSAEQLYNKVTAYFGSGKGAYIICEYSDNSQGLLNERSWYLLNNKELPPKKES